MKKLFLIACLTLTAFVVVAQDIVRLKGLELRPQAGADTTTTKARLGDGGMFYNDNADKLRVKVNGTWVNIVTSSIGATVTASNGLTKTVNNIALGGALTGNTTITGSNTNDMLFTGLDDWSLVGDNLGTLTSGGTTTITSTAGSVTATAAVNVNLNASNSINGSGTVGVGFTAPSINLENLGTNSIVVNSSGVSITANDTGDDLTFTAIDGIGINSTGATTLTAAGGVVVVSGAASPDFDITGAEAGQVNMRIKNTSTGASQIELQRTGGTTSSWLTYLPGSSTDLRLFSGGDRFIFTPASKFGIGSTSPTYSLDIQGSDGSVFGSRIQNFGAGDVTQFFTRSSGTNSDWKIYLPTGSTDLRFYSTSDKFIFTTAGLFTGTSLKATGLAGGGTQMVTTDNNGLLAAAAIPAGISGLTVSRVTFAASATSVTDAVNYQVDTSTDLLLVQNDAGTARTRIFGAGQVSVEDNTAFGERVTIDAGNGGDPSIVIVDVGGGTTTLDDQSLTGTGTPFTILVTGAGNDIGITPADDFLVSPDNGAGIPTGTFSSTSSELSFTSSESLGLYSTGSGNNVNITAPSAADVNITGNDDVNIVAEGDDIIASAVGDIQLLTNAALQLGSSSSTGLSTSGLIYSSTYTPTLTNGANVASSSASVVQYNRVGNTITISGTVRVTPTTTLTTTTLAFTVPVASNFSTFGDAGGTAVTNIIGTGVVSGMIQANASSDKLELNFVASGTGAHDFQFTVTYLKI